MVSFVVANLMIGEIANLGIVSINYFCSGSLLVSTIYFIIKGECSLKNDPKNKDAKRVKKVLLRTWSNGFDCWTLFICTIAACCQAAIFFSIMVCYAKSHQAGLNIGIAQAIWAINPFFVSLMERFVYGVGLKVF